MIPVQQSILADPARGDGRDADGRPGDCLRACVASLVEETLEDVPHFAEVADTAADPAQWWWELTAWVDRRFGDRMEIVCIKPEFPVYDTPREEMWPQHVIATGPSPRGDFNHCVLVDAWTGEMVHDPHPSGAGLAGEVLDLLALSARGT